LGLEQYTATFIKEELYKDTLSELNDALLEKIGINIAGHRMKILKACRQAMQLHPSKSADIAPTQHFYEDETGVTRNRSKSVGNDSPLPGENRRISRKFNEDELKTVLDDNGYEDVTLVSSTEEDKERDKRHTSSQTNS
jgi:hypothetical protein